MNFTFLKAIQNADSIDEHATMYIDQLHKVVLHIKRMDGYTIKERRQEFTSECLLEPACLLNRAGLISLDKVVEILEFIVEHYQWERSNKNYLEAILELLTALLDKGY